MNEATWSDWVDKHATIFNMTQEGQLLTLREWAQMFRKHGFTPQELIDASEWVAMNVEVRFREELLPKLRARVRDARLIGKRPKLTDPPPPDDPHCPRCPRCKGQGLIKVPHYEKMMHPLYAGRYWYDRDVACTCPLGEWHRKTKAGTIFAVQGIEDYEAAYPHWRDDAEQHRQEDAAFSKAMQAARSDDDSFGKLINRLVSKVQKHKRQIRGI